MGFGEGIGVLADDEVAFSSLMIRGLPDQRELFPISRPHRSELPKRGGRVRQAHAAHS